MSGSLEEILGDALAALEDRERTIARLLAEQKRTRTAITGLRALTKRLDIDGRTPASPRAARQLPAPGQPSGEQRVREHIEQMDAGARFSIPELARDLDIPPTSISPYLSKLVPEGVAHRVIKGLYESAGGPDTGPLDPPPNGTSPPSSGGF
jgi:hypothetical protein